MGARCSREPWPGPPKPGEAEPATADDHRERRHVVQDDGLPRAGAIPEPAPESLIGNFYDASTRADVRLRWWLQCGLEARERYLDRLRAAGPWVQQLTVECRSTDRLILPCDKDLILTLSHLGETLCMYLPQLAMVRLWRADGGDAGPGDIVVSHLTQIKWLIVVHTAPDEGDAEPAIATSVRPLQQLDLRGHFRLRRLEFYGCPDVFMLRFFQTTALPTGSTCVILCHAMTGTGATNNDDRVDLRLTAATVDRLFDLVTLEEVRVEGVAFHPQAARCFSQRLKGSMLQSLAIDHVSFGYLIIDALLESIAACPCLTKLDLVFARGTSSHLSDLGRLLPDMKLLRDVRVSLISQLWETELRFFLDGAARQRRLHHLELSFGIQWNVFLSEAMGRCIAGNRHLRMLQLEIYSFGTIDPNGRAIFDAVLGSTTLELVKVVGATKWGPAERAAIDHHCQRNRDRRFHPGRLGALLREPDERARRAWLGAALTAVRGRSDLLFQSLVLSVDLIVAAGPAEPERGDGQTVP